MNEAQTLTLEAGKYYRTRDGRKAFLAGRNPFESSIQLVWTGYVEGGIAIYGWLASGHFRYADGREDDCDLVAEWVEPKRIKGWVNIYPHPNMPQDVIVNNALHETKEKADGHSVGGRIACIEIDILEGHGLNGEAA